MRKKPANKMIARKFQSYERPDDAVSPVKYGGLQEGYDHFNKELFEGKLPNCFKRTNEKPIRPATSRPIGSPVAPGSSPSMSLRSIRTASLVTATCRSATRWCTKWCTCGSRALASRPDVVITIKSGRRR